MSLIVRNESFFVSLPYEQAWGTQGMTKDGIVVARQTRSNVAKNVVWSTVT